jgi:hypothetical protein
VLIIQSSLEGLHHAHKPHQRQERSFRLNHWLPRRQTHAKVMQRTADFHDQIADARLPKTVGVVDDATALHATVDVLDAHATARHTPVHSFLRGCEFPAPRFLGRHDHLDVRQRQRQEPKLLEQAAARRQGVRRGLRHALSVEAAGRGLTEQEHGQHGVNAQDVFYRVALFLAAITARLLSRILGTPDTPFGAIMPKRGEAGGGAGAAVGGVEALGGPCTGTTMALASASATPRRFSSSVKDRVGACPSVRSVACRTTNRTWIH